MKNTVPQCHGVGTKCYAVTAARCNSCLFSIEVTAACSTYVTAADVHVNSCTAAVDHGEKRENHVKTLTKILLSADCVTDLGLLIARAAKVFNKVRCAWGVYVKFRRKFE